jgi:anti-sigma factor RsiW
VGRPSLHQSKAVGERNHQVKIIAAIYRDAVGVLVWLGVRSDSTSTFVAAFHHCSAVGYPAGLHGLGLIKLTPKRANFRLNERKSGRVATNEKLHMVGKDLLMMDKWKQCLEDFWQCLLDKTMADPGDLACETPDTAC